MLLFPLNDEVQGFVSQLVSGALTAPLLVLVLTLLYFRLRAAKETPAPAAARGSGLERQQRLELVG